MLCLLDLILRQLNLGGLVRRILLLVLLACRLGLLILLRLLLSVVGRLFGTRLLGYLALHEVDGVLLELLPDLLLFALPLILKSVRTVPLVLRDGDLRFVFAILGHELKIKERVVQYLEVSHFL